MIFTDTHTHLYLNEFIKDRYEVIQRAVQAGVEYMLLPNIDSNTVGPMLDLCRKYPSNIFPMMGLHPTDVKENYKEEINIVEQYLEKEKFCAIGETGMDLYWDRTFIEEQKISLREHIGLAKKHNLPIVLHSRDSFNEIFDIIDDTIDEGLTGVFHCFGGTIQQAQKIINWGFKLGIGGVLTFKNSGLDEVIKNISLNHIILETDSPFLAPKPFRGKRNESAYLIYVAEKLAEIKNISIGEVSEVTTQNAVELFKLKK